MAIYYSRLSVVSRSRGHSAVAAAAYRTGARLADERTGVVHDFRKKRGVLGSEMLAPDGAGWAQDVAAVWNRAEHAEKRCNARVARELIVALPAELDHDAHVALARRIGRDLVERYGVAVLVAVHAPDPGSDARNVHAHLLMTVRTAGPETFGPKVRCLDDQKTGPLEAEAIRTQAAERINAALAEHGHAARVDPRPLSAQADEAAARGDFDAVVALARTPLRHAGRAATAASRRGEPSPIVSSNVRIGRDNRHVRLRGILRGSVLRSEIGDQVARRSAARRPAGSPAQARLAGRTTTSSLTAARSRSNTTAYLESLRDTQRFVEEQIRSGERADAARERAERLERDASAIERRVKSATQPQVSTIQAHRVVEEHGPTAPPPRTSVDNASAQQPLSTSSLSARQWAELRRRQRAETFASKDPAVRSSPRSETAENPGKKRALRRPESAGR